MRFDSLVQGVDYLSTSAQNKMCIALYALLATGPGLNWNEKRQRLEVSRALPCVIMAMLLIIYWAAGWTKAFQGGIGRWMASGGRVGTQAKSARA
jgi:hypothetical protein